jgi:hypothetical protein
MRSINRKIVICIKAVNRKSLIQIVYKYHREKGKERSLGLKLSVLMALKIEVMIHVHYATYVYDSFRRNILTKQVLPESLCTYSHFSF